MLLSLFLAILSFFVVLYVMVRGEFKQDDRVC